MKQTMFILITIISIGTASVTSTNKKAPVLPQTETVGTKGSIGKSTAAIKKEQRRQQAEKLRKQRLLKTAKSALARDQKLLKSITNNFAKELEYIEPFFGKSTLTDDEEDRLKSKLKRAINRRHVNAKETGMESFGRILFNTPSVSKLYPYMHFDQQLKSAKQSARRGLKKQQQHAKKVAALGLQVPNITKDFTTLLDNLEFLDKQFHLLCNEELTQDKKSYDLQIAASR